MFQLFYSITKQRRKTGVPQLWKFQRIPCYLERLKELTEAGNGNKENCKYSSIKNIMHKNG